MGITQAMRNKKASTGKGKSKAEPGTGNMEPGRAAPSATLIAAAIEAVRARGVTTVGGFQRELNLNYSAAAVIMDHLIDHGYLVFEPGPKGSSKAVILKEAPAGSMLEHGPTSIAVGKLDIDSAKPPLGKLVWDEGFGKDEWEAASIAYADTEGGLYWRIRPSGKGKSKGWSLYASDVELIEALPSSMIGPYSELETAKTICQDLDFKAGQENAEDSAKPPLGDLRQAVSDVPSGGNPQSAILNPQSRPPRAEMAWIPINRIDATHNVRTAMNEDTLFELQASIADVGQLEPVLVRKIGNAFRMVAGHQRLEAARRAGEEMIEAKVYGGDGVDDRWEAKARAAENIIRCGLTHVDQARLFGDDADKGLSVAEIAAIHHVSDDSVRRHLALRRLCPPVTMLVASGRLPLHQAELISRVGDPARQIALAEHATRLAWDAKDGRWTARGSFDWRTNSNKPAKGEPTIADRDFIIPMDLLRKAVADAMQGLAACGWPMGEEYAGKRRCFGCPDNTLTYADQPKLFEGIEPQGSAKKGHCTNTPCYAAKKAAWEKVVVQRRKDRERDQKKAIAAATKAGLYVCEADGCAKVLPSGEKLVMVSGIGMCPKCAEKEKERQASGGGGGGGSTWQDRDKRAKALKKQFPWTPEQKLASALHKHGQAVAELIAKAIEDGTAGSDGNCANLAEMVLWAQGADGYGSDAPTVRPTVEQVTGPGIPDADLAEWWRRSARWVEYSDEPGLNYDGKIQNVPLPAEHIGRIADMETIAEACGVTVPARPKAEEVDNGQGTVDSAAKPAAGKKKAVAGSREPVACPVGAGKKKKRKAVRAEDAEGAEKDKSGKTEPSSPDGSVVPGAEPFFCTRECDGCSIGCAVPGDSDNRMRSTILLGRKDCSPAAIERCADLAFLQEAEQKGLKGDWRRAAVAKRIEQLKEYADVASDREALASEDDGEEGDE